MRVWHKAHRLALSVYEATQCFPPDERFGLTFQLRRAAVSVPTNIAEGCGRHSERELARFITISAGSASEVEYLALLANELGYLDNDGWTRLTDEVVEVRKMLAALHRALARGADRRQLTADSHAADPSP